MLPNPPFPSITYHNAIAYPLPPPQVHYLNYKWPLRTCITFGCPSRWSLKWVLNISTSTWVLHTPMLVSRRGVAQLGGSDPLYNWDGPAKGEGLNVFSLHWKVPYSYY